MKYIKSIIVLTFLFALPAGSWYFLQTGLDWRRVKAKELVGKGSILEAVTMTPEDKALLSQKLKGKTSLIKLRKPQSQQDAELVRQFADAFTFQWVETATDLSIPKSTIEALKYDYEYDYVLVDTSLNVRQYYTGDDKETLTRIVEDIALMIPHRKSKDIKLKRTQDE